MSLRTGRNFRYAAGGNALTAVIMGIVGAYFSESAIFIAAAGLCIPALIALGFIRAGEISTLATGYLFQGFGTATGFLVICVIAGAATALLWLFVAESKPAKYED